MDNREYKPRPKLMKNASYSPPAPTFKTSGNDEAVVELKRNDFLVLRNQNGILVVLETLRASYWNRERATLRWKTINGTNKEMHASCGKRAYQWCTREDQKVKLTSPVTHLCIVGLMLLGCERPASDQNEKSKSSDASTIVSKVRFENPTLTINDRELAFPCRVADLTQTLGPPDRITKLIFTVSTWDRYGIIVHEGTPGNPISSIKFYFQKSDERFCPKSTFAGTVEYGGKKIEQKSLQNDLIEAGLMRDSTVPFYYSKEDGRFTIIANYENERLNGLSIGW